MLICTKKLYNCYEIVHAIISYDAIVNDELVDVVSSFSAWVWNLVIHVQSDMFEFNCLTSFGNFYYKSLHSFVSSMTHDFIHDFDGLNCPCPRMPPFDKSMPATSWQIQSRHIHFKTFGDCVLQYNVYFCLSCFATKIITKIHKEWMHI